MGSFPTGSAFELGRNVEVKSDSQKSSLFPWDNAGLSSSAAGAPFDMGSLELSVFPLGHLGKRDLSSMTVLSSMVGTQVNSTARLAYLRAKFR